MPTTWYGRNAGNNTNGIGFDAALGGTNYANQNSPQAALTDVVTNGTTTVTSASALFTAAMVGNYIYIAGGTGGITGAWYKITARSSSVSITVDRSTGLSAGTGATGNVGGAASTSVPITALVAAGDSVVWLPSDFASTGTLPVDHTKCGTTDSNDFPVVFIGGASHATVANGGQLDNGGGGHDWIAASDNLGATQLAVEDKSYDPTSGVCFAVIRRDISHTVDTAIYGWAGNPNITTSIRVPGAVWSATYDTVNHPDASTWDGTDSTVNGHNITNHGATAVAGSPGGAASFNGSSQYERVTTAGFPGVGANYSLSARVKSNSGAAFGMPICLGNNGNGQSVFLFVNAFAAGDIGFSHLYRDGGGNPAQGICSSPSGAAVGSWHTVAATWDQTNLVFWLNGVVAQTITSSTLYRLFDVMSVGNDTEDGNLYYFNGLVGERRLLNTPRPDGYYVAEHNNLDAPATFYTWSGWGGSSVSVSPAGLNVGVAIGTCTTTTTLAPSGLNLGIVLGTATTSSSVAPAGLNIGIVLGTTSNSITVGGLSVGIVLGTCIPSATQSVAGLDIGVQLGTATTATTRTVSGLDISIVLGTASTTETANPSGLNIGIVLGTPTLAIVANPSGLDLAVVIGTVTTTGGGGLTVSGLDIAVALGTCTPTTTVAPAGLDISIVLGSASSTAVDFVSGLDLGLVVGTCTPNITRTVAGLDVALALGSTAQVVSSVPFGLNLALVIGTCTPSITHTVAGLDIAVALGSTTQTASSNPLGLNLGLLFGSCTTTTVLRPAGLDIRIIIGDVVSPNSQAAYITARLGFVLAGQPWRVELAGQPWGVVIT